VQRRVGPAWTERGRPPAGYYTKRTAEDWLRSVLDEARRGTLPGLVKTGVTFSEAADEWLRYVEHDRDRKPSTIVGYKAILRAQLLPAFGDGPIESIRTVMIESWLAGTRDAHQGARPPPRHLQAGAEGLRIADQPGRRSRAAADAAERRHRRLLLGGGDGIGPRGVVDPGRSDLPDCRLHGSSTRRAARAPLARRRPLQPGRPGAVQLRGRGTDDAQVRQGPPVQMAPDVAEGLANFGQRENWTADDDLVFVGAAATSTAARSDVATTRPSNERASANSASTTSATPSAPA
jgi:hypothetical protein